MKKIILAFIIGIGLTSCASQKIMPKAINTVNSVSLEELNLERNDYEILNTITAEATIAYRERGKEIEITGRDDNFSITATPIIVKGRTVSYNLKHTGILKLGYLSNDYHYSLDIMVSPESVARHLAIYRLINLSKLDGADGVIEPVISTNVEQNGKEIIFKSTVTAKLIKLKTNN